MDTLRFGEESDSLIVKNVTFGLAKQIGKQFAEINVDGILGLAFTPIKIYTNAIEVQPIGAELQPPISKVIEQNLLNQPIFTVWLNAKDHEKNAPAGSITYGGIDTDNCNTNFKYYPLTIPGYYQFDINSISVGNKLWKTPKAQAISDTGNSFIFGPKNIVDGIAKEIKANYSILLGLYTVNCSHKYSPIIFTIGSEKYEIPWNQLNINFGLDKNHCIFGIKPLYGDNLSIDWVLVLHLYANIVHYTILVTKELVLLKPNK